MVPLGKGELIKCHTEKSGAVSYLFVGKQLQGWGQNGARAGTKKVPL